MSAFLRPRTVNPSSAFSVRLGRAVHRIATAISVVLLALAIILFAIAAYLAVTRSGKWANDYWFNPDWIQTAPWAVLGLAGGAVAYLAGRLIRYLLSRE